MGMLLLKVGRDVTTPVSAAIQLNFEITIIYKFKHDIGLQCILLKNLI
jgi:hypothetical protein